MTVMVIGAILAPVHAQEASAPDNSAAANTAGRGTEINPSDIKAPWDFAPPEQVVAGRDPMSFRKEGTLLARTSREIPTVDERDLLDRKYAMYDGRRFYSRPTQAGETSGIDTTTLERTLAVSAAQAGEGTPSPWLPWTLAVVITAVVLVAWRKGWFVPFSIRAAERRASRAASARPRSRVASGPPRKVQPRGPGG